MSAVQSESRFRALARRLFSGLPGARSASRIAADPGLRTVAFVFTLSRVTVLAILLLTALLQITPDPDFPGHFDASLNAEKVQVARILRQEVQTADINWYIGIAEHGYEHRPSDAQVPHNWVFFPLFPLVLHLAHYLTGEFALTGAVLSHIFFFFALLLLYRLAVVFGFAENSPRAVFYLAFFPVSYFFSLPVTESLFLLLTVASFLSAKLKKWWLAGLIGALASATRFSGVLLLPALVVLYFESGRDRPRKLGPELAWLLIIPSGLVAFMAYLHAITGDALAFVKSQAAWSRRPGFFLTPLYDYLANPAEIVAKWDFRTLNFVAAVMVVVCAVVLFKRRQFALATYSILSVVLTLSSTLLQSQARYAMVVFPVYLVLGVAGRNDKVDQVLRLIFIVLLTFLTAMFARHVTLALS